MVAGPRPCRGHRDPHPRPAAARGGRPGRRADRGLRRGRSRDLAGRPERVDPARTGPRRRPAAVGPGHADPVRRPRRAHGLQPRRRTRPAQRCGRAADRARPRGRRARTVHRLQAGRGCRRNARGTAGHRGLHRKSPHRSTVSRRGAEQRERLAQSLRCRPGGGCRVYLAAALPRHGSDVSAQRHADGGTDVAGPDVGVHRVTVPLVAVAQRKRRLADRGAEHGLQHDRQVRPAGLRRRPGPGAGDDQRRRARRLHRHGAVRECVERVRL